VHEIGAVHAASAGFLTEVAGRLVRQVTVALGPDVDADVVDTTWRMATKDSSAADAAVIWTRLDDLLSCLGCGQDFRGTKLDRCPVCGSDGLVIEPAEEVTVVGWLPGN
jgi:Hydrogenase expression/synthesis hypA family.